MSEDPLGSSIICKLRYFSCSTSTPSLGVQYSEILSSIAADVENLTSSLHLLYIFSSNSSKVPTVVNSNIYTKERNYANQSHSKKSE